MQGFALSVSDKQLIKTFFITFIAVVAGLPVASALMPTRQDVLAQENGSKNAVSKTAEELGLGACGTGTGAAKTASSKHTHEVVTRTVTQTGNNQNGTNNSQNTGSASAQVGRDGIAAAVNANALNDLVDVNDVLNGNTVTVPVNIPVNVPILSGSNSGTGNGGLLGLGILGL